MNEQPPGADVVEAGEGRFLRLSRDAFAASTTYFNANVRDEIERDLRQWQSRHPSGSKYESPAYRGRSRLFRPKTRAFVQKSEAKIAEAFFSSVDIVDIRPDDMDDPLSVKGAAFYQALLQKRLSMPAPHGVGWYLTCLGAYQDALVSGLCISMQTWEYAARKGVDRPRIDLVPIENFRFDPGCDWRDVVSTSPYLIHLMPLYIGEIRQRIKEGKYRPVPETALTAGARSYSDSIRLARDANRSDPKTQRHETTDFDLCWVHCNIVEVDGEDWQWYTIGAETMLSDPVKVGEKYPHGRPYCVGFATVETHRTYPSSPTRLARDTQREANELANSRLDNVAFVLNKRYFAKRNRQIDLASLVRNMPGSATLMEDPATDVRVVETPDVTRSSYEEQDRLNLDFDDVTGGMAQSSVASNRKLNETVGGMNILQSNQNTVEVYRLHTFIKTWVERVLSQLMALERYYESDVRIVTMAVQAAGLEPDEVGDWLWDMDATLSVNVAMNAMSPHERMNVLLFAFNSIKSLLADGALEQRGMDARELVKEIFAMAGYRDGSRFFQWGKQDPMVLYLQQTVRQLQQQVDAKMPRELLVAQVEKLAAETVAKNMTSFYSAMQAAQVAASVPSVAPIADVMLESSGFKPNPAGVDPNIPAPTAPDPALTQGDVYNPRTGVGFMPGRQNTSPAFPPLPMQPDQGAGAGIETARADGVR